MNLLAGDVPSLRWPGRPIELAIVTWYRDPQQLGFVWRELLPWCVPGGSLIIIDGIRGGTPDPRTQLGPLLGHLEILAAGPNCLALAPIDAVVSEGAGEPAELSALGVPLDAGRQAGAGLGSAAGLC